MSLAPGQGSEPGLWSSSSSAALDCLAPAEDSCSPTSPLGRGGPPAPQGTVQGPGLGWAAARERGEDWACLLSRPSPGSWGPWGTAVAGGRGSPAQEAGNPGAGPEATILPFPHPAGSSPRCSSTTCNHLIAVITVGPRLWWKLSSKAKERCEGESRNPRRVKLSLENPFVCP